MDWLRLWHDMPNDPKWRTVARISGQPVSLVVSMFIHLLVDASRNVTRGHADVTNEDLASALDVTEEQIQSIRDAMQGRVLDGNKLLGWDKRQPKKEDAGNPETGAKSSAERKREQRERDRLKAQNDACHDESRYVTECHDRLDKRREEEENPSCPSTDERFVEFWKLYPRKDSRKTALKAYQKLKPDDSLHARILAALSVAKASFNWTKDNGQFIPLAASWLNAERWNDEGTKAEKEPDFFVPPGKVHMPGIGFVDKDAYS